MPESRIPLVPRPPLLQRILTWLFPKYCTSISQVEEVIRKGWENEYAAKFAEMDAKNQELRERISTLTTEASNLRAAAIAAQDIATAATARADQAIQDHLHTLKTQANWLASGVATRVIHPDAPIGSLPEPPKFQDDQGNPITGARGIRASKVAKAQTLEVVKKNKETLAEHEARLRKIAEEDAALYETTLAEVMKDMIGIGGASA